MSANQNNMRVKCIEKSEGKSVITGNKYKDIPEIGEEFNVIHTEEFKGKVYYQLERKTDEGILVYWNAECFKIIEK